MPLSKAQISQINKARTVGGSPAIYLDNEELAALMCVVCHDLGLEPPFACQQNAFYAMPVDGIREPLAAGQVIEEVLGTTIRHDPDVFSYFIALTSLHAQRRKLHAILAAQRLPELETVMPRGLLEAGGMTDEALASWLVWRKYLYDLDNRAAQTTGYLFEPILAAAIGGVPYSATNSPVRRGGTGRGRQVDCIVSRDAYEFKMRVTIAASGQGRFAGELSFAEDCHLSGYRPVLLVLDPTPSDKLHSLSDAFRQFGGEAYVGAAAWDHLETQAGETMAIFLEKYIRMPMAAIEATHRKLLPLSIERRAHHIILQIGDHTFSIAEVTNWT